MRRLLVAAFVLLIAPSALASLPGPSPGPFTGSVAQGEADSHHFSTHGDQPCLAVWMPRTYVVSVTYGPPTDTLTIAARGFTDSGNLGRASVSFVANYCTAFDITVTGSSVASSANYVVTVTSTPVVDIVA